MTTLDDSAREALALLESKLLKRTLATSERTDGVSVMRSGRTYVSFSCNDYFGLSHHPDVIAAGVAALQQYGAGAGASRLVTGNHPLYEALEDMLARMKGTEAACVFGSGYLANLGVIPVLAGSGDLILADRLSHACMLDGARMSGATMMRFAHNNPEHLALLLREHRKEYQRCIILTETVFSMDGDRAPLGAFAALAKGYNAWLMTDDAHGLGIAEPEAHAEVQMGTLSKGAGSYGGYVCASREVVELVRTSARTLMFSTALPPASVASATAALNIIASDKALTSRPLQLAQRFTQFLGLDEAQSPIVPLILEEPERALAASRALEEAGYLAHAIRPPTVPPGTARLRFTFSALHTEAQVDGAADVLKANGYA